MTYEEYQQTTGRKRWTIGLTLQELQSVMGEYVLRDAPCKVTLQKSQKTPKLYILQADLDAGKPADQRGLYFVGWMMNFFPSAPLAVKEMGKN